MLGRLRPAQFARCVVLRRTMNLAPARWMSSKDDGKDDIDFMDIDEFDEIGLSESDLGAAKKQALNPLAPPTVSFDNYEKLKGINFSDRGVVRDEQSKLDDDEWQAKLDELRVETDKKFAFSQSDLQKIRESEVPEEKTVHEFDEGGILNDEDLASTFGSAVDNSDYFEDTKVPMEQFYDPAAFPFAEDTDSIVPKKKKGKCIFCLPDPTAGQLKQITYTNVQLLHRFINERGMITSRRYNYNCAKHQRKLATAIKQARYIGLLGYTNNFYAPETFASDFNPSQIPEEGSNFYIEEQQEPKKRRPRGQKSR